jgi:hypothetical protein
LKFNLRATGSEKAGWFERSPAPHFILALLYWLGQAVGAPSEQRAGPARRR